MQNSDLIKLLLERRSVRSYTGEPIPEELLEKILCAGMAAPTGRNLKTWEFILVREREKLNALAKCREMGSAMLKDADAAIVVVGDSTKTDVWAEDCSIAMAYMHLMADSLGVGSCWIQGRNRQKNAEQTTEAYVQELLQIPQKYKLEAILSLGMTEKHPAPHLLSDLPAEKIHRDVF